MKRHAAVAVALICLVGPLRAEQRVWTDGSGELQVEAELVDFNDVKIWLKRSDGRLFAVGMEEVSEADRQYIRRQARRRAAEIAAGVQRNPGAIRYGPPRKLAYLANELIDESSGLACSRNRPGVFWTHNDSGGEARIYAFDATGKDLGSCVLTDVRAYDWEDMASFRRDGKSYLLLGDIGNNGLGAAIHMLYLVEEPPINPARGVVPSEIPVVQLIHFGYQDDHRNCEALAVDPTTRTILFVTKQTGTECYIYAMPWPKNDPKKVTAARKIATLKIPTATALDVSPDGRRAVVATYGNAYEYSRGVDEDWAAAFSRRGRMIALPRREQGESICYGPDGKTLYLTSEKLPTPLLEIRVSP